MALTVSAGMLLLATNSCCKSSLDMILTAFGLAAAAVDRVAIGKTKNGTIVLRDDCCELEPTVATVDETTCFRLMTPFAFKACTDETDASDWIPSSLPSSLAPEEEDKVTLEVEEEIAPPRSPLESLALDVVEKTTFDEEVSFGMEVELYGS